MAAEWMIWGWHNDSQVGHDAFTPATVGPHLARPLPSTLEQRGAPAGRRRILHRRRSWRDLAPEHRRGCRTTWDRVAVARLLGPGSHRSRGYSTCIGCSCGHSRLHSGSRVSSWVAHLRLAWRLAPVCRLGEGYRLARVCLWARRPLDGRNDIRPRVPLPRLSGSLACRSLVSIDEH